MSLREIYGIVIGCIVGVVIIVCLIIIICVYIKKRYSSDVEYIDEDSNYASEDQIEELLALKERCDNNKKETLNLLKQLLGDSYDEIVQKYLTFDDKKQYLLIDNEQDENEETIDKVLKECSKLYGASLYKNGTWSQSIKERGICVFIGVEFENLHSLNLISEYLRQNGIFNSIHSGDELNSAALCTLLEKVNKWSSK